MDLKGKKIAIVAAQIEVPRQHVTLHCSGN
jgi:hypothetical protein